MSEPLKDPAGDPWDDDVVDEPGENEDWGYAPDPDAPSTLGDRLETALDELRKLSLLSVIVTAVIGCGLYVLERMRGSDGALTSGFLLGAGTALVNLVILGRASLSLFAGSLRTMSALLGFGVSIAILVGASIWVVAFHRTWLSGFALGLASPAVVGVVYAVRAARSTRTPKGT
jgi:hypothetical protein